MGTTNDESFNVIGRMSVRAGQIAKNQFFHLIASFLSTFMVEAIAIRN